MKKTIFILFLSIFWASIVNAQKKERTSKLNTDSTGMFTSSGLARGGSSVFAYNHGGKDYIIEDKDGFIKVWEIVRCYPKTYRLKMVGNPIPVSEGSRKSTANYINEALNYSE
jgi:hypothetical protein